MHRFVRYVIALVAAGAITAGVATTYRSVILLTGIFQVFAVAIAILLRYPSLLWGSNSETRMASAVFAGVTTFGVCSLAEGIGAEYHLGAGILGFGLGIFGMSAGIWMADELQA
ncbi:hypothetical protein ACFOZ7_02405 [Natribaculum luteum]|uniref:Uncharacterized protein n=1 Tax=Natribaculum luteum TaxID=1586232 RepID=A0ABD5NVR2_9EURY|nr:hypothetical protein [Natribaculum luteum]